MADNKSNIPTESLQLVNFYGSVIPIDEYRRLMQDEDERAAYLDFLRG